MAFHMVADTIRCTSAVVVPVSGAALRHVPSFQRLAHDAAVVKPRGVSAGSLEISSLSVVAAIVLAVIARRALQQKGGIRGLAVQVGKRQDHRRGVFVLTHPAASTAWVGPQLIKLPAQRGCCALAGASSSLAARRSTGSVTRSAAGWQSLDWVVPEDYNWEVCTQENYAASESSNVGPLAAARELVDAGYHGHYVVERQQLQDKLVLDLLPNRSGPRKAPLLLFTAGAMGVGKSFVIKWMAQQGLLPLEEFALIDPDRIAQQLPEYPGYAARASASASVMTRLEAGLLTELGLVWALQQRRNILVDSSLRHGSWYASLLKKLRGEVPEVRVVLVYVHTSEEIIYRRAQERGRAGRVAMSSEVQDSLQKMPRAIGRLLPHVDFFAQVANDGDQPRVTSICSGVGESSKATGASQPLEAENSNDNDKGDKDEEEDEEEDEEDEDEMCDVIDPSNRSLSVRDVGWSEIRDVLSSAFGGVPAQPLQQPPRILPTSSAKEPRPLLQLLRTVVFSAGKHRHQRRKDPNRTPYVNHPLAVARILAEVGIRDLATLQVALLHDTLEDTATTSAELGVAFGSEVADLVESLTDDDSLRPTTRKLWQLREAPSLRYKAKLVRIADKLHNVRDIIHHGIPGWTKERAAAYVAWACEMVTALRGTHANLERRFFSEVSLPSGYRLGDWEKNAAQKVDDGSWPPLSELPQERAREGGDHLQEHKSVLSLLRAAEFLAQQQSSSQKQDLDVSDGPRTDFGLIWALNAALALAQHDVRDAETLEAALICGAIPRAGGTGAAAAFMEQVRRSFGEEVAEIVGVLTGSAAQEDPSTLPIKAKLIVLSQQFWSLKSLQIGGLADEAAADSFRIRVRRAWEVRRLLAGTHKNLEAGLDEVFGGQVRLASGELVPVADIAELQGRQT